MPTFGMSNDSRLEEEHQEPFDAWKANPTPAGNATFLTHLQPTIDKVVNVHVGQNNPLITSKARRMTLDAMKTYDPKRSRLQTHLYNQLQGLKRVQRQQGSIVSVPEKVSLDRYHLDRHTQELSDELGRDPSDAELADRTGFSPRRMQRVRSYRPAVAEGTLEAANEGNIYGGNSAAKATHSPYIDLIYHDMAPIDQLILEHSIGYNGKRRLSNEQIAQKIKRTPGLVSQRKKAIQEMLDRENELSPF